MNCYSYQSTNAAGMRSAVTTIPSENGARREDTIMCNSVDKKHMGVDACAWMLEPESRQTTFFGNLDAAQKLTGKVVWTNEEVIAEIRRKVNSPRQGLARAAQNALRQIDKMIRENRLIVYEAVSTRPDQRKFADAAFLSLLIKNSDVPVTLVTLDGDLAEDALNLKDMHSIEKSLAKIDVYRVNSNGYLGKFNFVTTADGRVFNPKNSPLQTDADAQVSQMDNTFHPMPNADEGDVFFSACGNMFKLGAEMSNGGEADIYAVEGCPEIVAKVFTSLSDRKEAKCRMLHRIAQSFPCDSAVLPLDILFDVDGKFRGYVMKKIHGVEATRMLTSGGQQKYVPNWNRKNYAQLAAGIADCFRDLSLMGLNIVDVSPGNILIGYNDSGVLDPGKIFFIDLDSAQFGCRENAGSAESKSIVYPADGLTKEYAPPECLRMGFTPNMVLSHRNLVFGVAILCLQIAMCGIHPYRKTVQEEGQMLSIPGSIAAGAFPYGSGVNTRMAMSPSGAEKLWSNMSSEMKKFFHGLFQQGGANNSIDKRPSFFMLSKVLNNYVNWLEKPETLQRYPEVLSMMPSALKPFYARCSHNQCRTPEKEFAVTVFRTDGQYFCEDCLQRIRSKRNAEAHQVPDMSYRPVSVGTLHEEQPQVYAPFREATAPAATVPPAGEGFRPVGPLGDAEPPRVRRRRGMASVLDAIQLRKIFNLD